MKFIGTQYFRPPHPAECNWDADLQAMRAHGLTMVRCWLYWRVVEPAAGVWDFSQYDRFLDAAHRHGLGVLVQLLPECQPAWFLEQHRDLWPRDVAGQPLPQLGYGMVTIGGYPGILFDQPAAADGIARFYRETVRHYRAHPALRLWDVWNEIQPHGGTYSFDDVTRRAWHAWLRQRHGTIAAYRERSQHLVGAFEEIDLPDFRNPNAGSSWLLAAATDFFRARLAGEMARRAGLVRELDTAHSVIAHTCNSDMMSWYNDDARLAQAVDSYGTSQYTSPHSHGAGHDWTVAAMEYALCRAAAPDKPWWLAEHSAGQIYYHYGHYQPSAAEVRAGLLLAAMQGAESAYFWQYRPESFGQESPGWGLTALDGSPDDRLEAVRGVAQFLERESAVLATARRPAAPIGVLHDQQTRTLENFSQAWVKQEVAVEREQNGWYAAAQAAGLAVDFQRAERVQALGVPATCRVLIVPMHMQTRAGLYDQLIAWTEAGGSLIVTAYSGTFDAGGWLAPAIPVAPLGTALGATILRRSFPSDLGFAADGCQLHGHWVLETPRLAGAAVVASVDGAPALLRRQVGRGEILYFTTLPGHGYLKHGGALADWLGRVALRQGAAPWLVTTPGVLSDRAMGPDGQVLYLVNQTNAPATICLRGAVLGRSRWRDALSDAPLATLDGVSDVPVTIPARDGRCLVNLTKEQARA